MRVKEALKNKQSLQPFFQSLLLTASSFKPLDRHHQHIIVLNALKNISGLRLENPSKPVLDYAAQLVSDLTPNEIDDVWLQVPSDKLSQSLFVMDFISAVESQNHEKAVQEGAKIYLLSQNKMYLMDLLLEICSHQFAGLGLVGCSYHQATVFCKGENPKGFMKTLLDEVLNYKISIVAVDIPDDFEINDLADIVFQSDSIDTIIMFATAHRLWNFETIKQRSVKQGIVRWLADLYNGNGKTCNNFEYVESSSKIHFLQAIIEKSLEGVAANIYRSSLGGKNSWAVELAEYWIEVGLIANPVQFAALDAIQYLSKVLDKRYIPILANHLINMSHI